MTWDDLGIAVYGRSSLPPKSRTDFASETEWIEFCKEAYGPEKCFAETSGNDKYHFIALQLLKEHEPKIYEEMWATSATYLQECAVSRYWQPR